MKKVYIAGKLNGHAVDYIKNVHAMVKAANTIRKLGYSVYIPCLDLLSGLIDGNMDYEDYFENNLPWLESADILFILPNSEDSKGTQKEICRAVALGIPVILSIKELVN
jgi:nucleoside 2-deoxyribosyltransferase